MIKHLKGFTEKELKKLNPDIPIWKRREVLLSPLVIPIGVGYMIYFIFYAINWIIKWSLLSWIAPFIDWRYFCNIGFHKYRAKYPGSETYKCKICNKELETNWL